VKEQSVALDQVWVVDGVLGQLNWTGRKIKEIKQVSFVDKMVSEVMTSSLACTVLCVTVLQSSVTVNPADSFIFL
jgi:hypothetical protein